MTRRTKKVVAGLLVASLVGRTAARQRKHVRGIQPRVRDHLARRALRGDLRALQEDIERIVTLLRDGDVITSAHLLAASEPDDAK